MVEAPWQDGYIDLEGGVRLAKAVLAGLVAGYGSNGGVGGGLRVDGVVNTDFIEVHDGDMAAEAEVALGEVRVSLPREIDMAGETGRACCVFF